MVSGEIAFLGLPHEYNEMHLKEILAPYMEIVYIKEGSVRGFPHIGNGTRHISYYKPLKPWPRRLRMPEGFSVAIKGEPPLMCEHCNGEHKTYLCPTLQHQPARPVSQTSPGHKEKQQPAPLPPRTPQQLQEQEGGQSDAEYNSAQEEGETSGEEDDQTHIPVELDEETDNLKAQTPNEPVILDEATTNTHDQMPIISEDIVQQRNEDFPPLTRDPQTAIKPQGMSTSTPREPRPTKPEKSPEIDTPRGMITAITESKKSSKPVRERQQKKTTQMEAQEP